MIEELPTIFREQPKLDPQDWLRLVPNLVNWNHLNEILLLGQLSEDDLKKLVLIELKLKHRKDIINKLIGRIMTIQREETWEKVDTWLQNQNSNEK